MPILGLSRVYDRATVVGRCSPNLGTSDRAGKNRGSLGFLNSLPGAARRRQHCEY